MPSTKPVLKAYVTPEEYQAVIELAERYGLSVSAYVRRVSLGDPPPSRDSQQLRRELTRVNGDLGRLGGLFKQWLGEEKQTSPQLAAQVRGLLRAIEARQRELKAAVQRIA